MVRWLDPHQLLDTAVRVLISGIFSSYADNRELQALEPAEVPDRCARSDLWLDYVADLGDGWNSTYTIARLLATEELKVEWDGEARTTERGRILVMGGDAVYPVPKAAEYENRMLGPYRSALPCARGDAPELFAIPGSHDWYDGLVNFTSIFCRDRSIGGWKTGQHRSYFALKLPNHWWLWGIDIQFGAYIDQAQLRYFTEVAVYHMEPGDQIILCMAKEVESGRKAADIHSDRDVEYLEREIIQPTGARVALYLKSGKHHYARYESEDGARQHIASGGGGAFLHPTHDLPETMSHRGAEGAVTYHKTVTYPSPKKSKGLRKYIWLLPPYNLPLASVLGTVQLLLVFMMGLQLKERYLNLGLGDLPRAVWESPTAFLLIIAMILFLAAMVRFAHDARGIRRFMLGLVHSTLQLGSVAGVLILSSTIASGSGLGSGWSLVVFLSLVAVLGGIGGILAMSAYLWATNCLGFHANEGYAPLHYQHFKHFLRLHIEADGTLTVYPIGVDKVGRKWRLDPNAPAYAPWFAPEGAEPESHLIEKPITVPGPRSTEPQATAVAGAGAGATADTASTGGEAGAPTESPTIRLPTAGPPPNSPPITKPS